MSLNHNGIEVETHEKHNVMTSGIHMSYVFVTSSILLMVLPSTFWIKLLGAAGFIINLAVILVVYISHNIKNPELLQSEKFRIEKMYAEAQMVENKQNDLYIATSIENSPKNVLIVKNNEEEEEETL